VGLVLGVGLGAHPLGFLAATPGGGTCLTVAAGLELAGLAWTDRLAARALVAA
jgi:tight adherence protein B